jgi:hypothetical protein
VATAWRYVREAINLLAETADDLPAGDEQDPPAGVSRL